MHPVPQGELLDEWSDMVEALIRQHIRKPNLGADVVVADEWHDGNGTNILIVRKPSIVSVQAVYINDVQLTASDYVVFDTYVELKSGVFPEGALNVRVSYTSGGITIDPVIRLAAIAMIAAIVNYRKRAGSDGSRKWASPEIQVGEDAPTANIGLASHLTKIMKQFLRRDTRIR